MWVIWQLCVKQTGSSAVSGNSLSGRRREPEVAKHAEEVVVDEMDEVLGFFKLRSQEKKDVYQCSCQCYLTRKTVKCS